MITGNATKGYPDRCKQDMHATFSGRHPTLWVVPSYGVRCAVQTDPWGGKVSHLPWLLAEMGSVLVGLAHQELEDL